MAAMDCTVRLRMLGGFSLSRGQKLVSRFRSRKAAVLLAYLALYPGRSHRREALTELVFSDADPEFAANSFRVTLARVREALKSLDLPVEKMLLIDRSSLCLSGEYFTSDVAEFDSLLRDSRKDKANSDALEHAIELYNGPLLDGYDDEWIIPERSRREESYLTSLRRLTADKIAGKAYEEGLEYARRTLALDSTHEETHCQIMRAYIALGRPAAARRQFLELERLLQAELGIGPSQRSRQLLVEVERIVRETERTTVRQLTITSTSNHLPPETGRFFGRQEEINDVTERLLGPDVRCITVTGSGGTGKTRFASEVARRVAGGFGGGVFWVGLESAQEFSQIGQWIAEALSIELPKNHDTIEALCNELLRRERTLIILDNLEHLLDADGMAAKLLYRLMEHTHSVVFLATSRQRIFLSCEDEYPLMPLPTPLLLKRDCRIDVDFLLEFPSVQLFLDRVRLVRNSFTLTQQNAVAVADLCFRLDGLPLALELTAAWARTLSIPQILGRLSQGWDVFPNTLHNVAGRHRTFYAAMEWSYRLLPENLQQFFRSLAVFQGRWTLEATEFVTQEPQALQYLHELQTRSLILGFEQGQELWFRMLETLREFCLGLLTDDERRQLRRRHTEYYSAWVEKRVAEETRQGYFDPVEMQYGNLTSALEWCINDTESLLYGVRLTVGMFPYWSQRGSLNDGRRYLQGLLALPGMEGYKKDKLKLLRRAGTLAEYQGDFKAAFQQTEEAILVAEQIGDNAEHFAGLNALGTLTRRLEGPSSGRSYFERAVAIARCMDNPLVRIMPLLNLGEVLLYSDLNAAYACIQEALTVSKEHGSERGAYGSLACLGLYYNATGEFDLAVRCFDEALGKARQAGDHMGIEMILNRYIIMLLKAGREEQAEALCCEMLALNVARGERPFICYTLWNLVKLYHKRDATIAVRLLAATDSLHAQYSSFKVPEDTERLMEHLRSALGDITFEHHYEIGRMLTLEQAAEEALAFSGYTGERLDPSLPRSLV